MVQVETKEKEVGELGKRRVKFNEEDAILTKVLRPPKCNETRLQRI